MLALKQNGSIIVSTIEEGGWAQLPNGRNVWPATDGWSEDGYSLSTLQEGDVLPAVEWVRPPAEPALPEPAPRLLVPKSVVMDRVSAAGKMGAAYAALTQSPDKFAKWFAPDKPFVYCDDPQAIAVVQALGLDPVAILAP